MSSRNSLYVVAGVAVAAGVAVLVMRRKSPVSTVATTPARAFARRVYHRERAAGVDARLQAFLDWWEANGPFPISVDPQGGVRTDEAAQAALYASHKSNAKTLGDTPHGRGGALDLYPVLRANPDTGAVFELATDTASPELFTQMGQLAKSRGLVWGGDWQSLKDRPHVEVPNWRSLQYPRPGVPGVA